MVDTGYGDTFTGDGTIYAGFRMSQLSRVGRHDVKICVIVIMKIRVIIYNDDLMVSCCSSVSIPQR
jgi:hypothetical protein